ncbi:flagellar hook-length control protein FliK, partial [Stappia sp.]|uniref:flagellar hook-length control protein FliK n=1 Tax=Stappia sp. TaxID=1870903 RepID=UPI003A98D25C
GAAGAGGAIPQPGMPGAAADDGPSGDGLRPVAAGVSLSAKATGVAAGDPALGATGGGTMQAATGTATAGLTLPASGGVAAALPGETVRADVTQTAGMQAKAAAAGNGATDIAATGAGGTVSVHADAAGSSEGLFKASAATGGNTTGETVVTSTGISSATSSGSAGLAGAAGGTGGEGNSVTMAGDVNVAATGETGTGSGAPGLKPASLDGAVAATGVGTTVRAEPTSLARDLASQLPESLSAESRTATGAGIGVRAGSAQAPAVTTDGDVGALPGEAPETAAATARTGASPATETSVAATAGATVRPARDASVAGGLSLSGSGSARSLAGGVIPAGDIDISISVSAETDGATGAGISRMVSPERGSSVVDGQMANGQQAAIGQAAKVLPRGEASAAARSSELDYAQAVEQAASGTPGQDGDGTAAAREGSGKPATGTAAQVATQPSEIQRPGVSAAALAFAAAMAEGDPSQGEGGDPFNGLTEIARADAQASVSTAALRGSTAALPQNAAVASAHLAAEVARFVQKGQTRFQIRMDPAELGRVDVELKVSRDGTVRAHLAVERSETLDMFLRDQRGLEKALDAAGLKLESGGLEMSLKNQDGSTAFDRGEGGDSRSSQPGEGGVLQKEDGDTLPMAAARAYVSGASGALDIQI